MWNNVVRQLAQSNQISVFETPDTISIESTREVVDKLKQNIGSRVNTRELMQRFAITSRNDATALAAEREAEAISLLPYDQIQFKETFNRLFQEALEGSSLSATNGNVDWDDDKTVDGILYSKAKVVTSRQLTVYKVQVQAIQILLATTNLTLLRSAFSDAPMPIVQEEDVPGPVASMANKIIGMTEEPVETDLSKKNVRIYFDCRRLLGLIQCFDHTSSSETQITINKQSLIDFLSVSLPQSLAITEPGRKPIIAEPRDSKAYKVPHDLHLILDCSGSIGELSPYFEQIAKFVSEVGKISADQMIRTTLFDFKYEELMPMRADSHIYLQALMNLKGRFSGETQLEGAILKVLKTVDSLALTCERNASVVVFTDGGDTCSSPSDKISLKNRINAFSEKSNPPQFTFVQIGKQADRDFFDRFSKATSGLTIDLNDPRSFDPLYTRIRELTAEKGDIREFFDEQNRVLATVRPILGELTQLNLTLPKAGFSLGRRGQEPTKFTFN